SLQAELGLAMLFITHDLSVLTDVSDRLAIMYAGNIVEEGSARQVLRDPKHPYTRALPRALPELGHPGVRRAPAGLGGDPREPGGGKPTLARAIMGLVKPERGVILFRGERIKHLKAYRRKVQMIFQDPTGALNPRQTIYESVAEGLRIHKVRGAEDEMVARAL